jgi:hypothetical protein
VRNPNTAQAVSANLTVTQPVTTGYGLPTEAGVNDLLVVAEGPVWDSRAEEGARAGA